MKRILVVDDSEALRLMFKELLEREGFEVETADNGTEALKLITRENLPACIITDLEMPEMDGKELARNIKSLYPQIPVLMMTGNPDLAEGAPVLKVLRKPISKLFDLVDLVKLVTDIPTK